MTDDDDTHGIPEHVNDEHTDRVRVPHARETDMGGAFRDAWIGLRECVDRILFIDGELSGDVDVFLSLQSIHGDEWPLDTGGGCFVTLTVDAQLTVTTSEHEIKSRYGAALKAIGINRIVVVNLPQSVDL